MHVQLICAHLSYCVCRHCRSIHSNGECLIYTSSLQRPCEALKCVDQSICLYMFSEEADHVSQLPLNPDPCKPNAPPPKMRKTALKRLCCFLVLVLLLR